MAKQSVFFLDDKSRLLHDITQGGDVIETQVLGPDASKRAAPHRGEAHGLQRPIDGIPWPWIPSVRHRDHCGRPRAQDTKSFAQDCLVVGHMFQNFAQYRARIGVCRQRQFRHIRLDDGDIRLVGVELGGTARNGRLEFDAGHRLLSEQHVVANVEAPAAAQIDDV